MQKKHNYFSKHMTIPLFFVFQQVTVLRLHHNPSVLFVLVSERSRID